MTSRPNTAPAYRPQVASQASAFRPSASGQWNGSRPSATPHTGAWTGNPNYANRPGGGWNGTTNWANRPGTGWTGNANNWNHGNGNHDNWAANRFNDGRSGFGIDGRRNIGLVNHTTFTDVNGFYAGNRGYGYNNWNHTYYNGRPYYAGYYRPWYHGSWVGWYNRPWFWGSTGFVTGYALGTGWNYYNPYWSAPAYDTSFIAYDYGQPLPAPAVVTDVPYIESFPSTEVPLPAPTPIDPQPAPQPQPQQQSQDPKLQQALRVFETARGAFKAGDYAAAQKAADDAIRQQPSDAVLHEFRALTLFAQGNYRDAAATLYPVLAAGPGWDWDTMKALYADPATYTRQLDALQAFVAANPNDAAARFVLAYQCLVLGERDAAARHLGAVVDLNPNDQVAAGMLKAITAPAPSGDRPVIRQ